MKIISWGLILFGVLLLTSIFLAGDRGRDDYFYMLSIAASFVVLGALGKEYVRQQYKGGAPTVIGAIFSVLGVQFIVFTLEQYFRGVENESVGGGAVAVVIFLVPGIALLRYGHKAHKNSD